MTKRTGPTEMLTKRCSTCKQTKARDEFHGDRSRGDGLSARCKDCDRKHKATLRNRLRSRNANQVPEVRSKVCSRCGQTKPSADFYVIPSNKDGLSHICKSCEREKSRSYHAQLSARSARQLPRISTKRCPVCGEEKDPSEFYRAVGKPNGYSTLCKNCASHQATERAKRVADRAFSDIKLKGAKRCTFCGKRFPVREFNYCRSNLDGLSSYCRACGVEYKQRHYNERQHEYYDRTVHRRQKYPDRERAYRIVQAAINRGEVVRPETCTKCGGGGCIVAHHDDYEDPMDFRWLCLSCSRQIRADQQRERPA